MTQTRLLGFSILCTTLLVAGCAKKAPPATSASPSQSVGESATLPSRSSGESKPGAASQAGLSDEEIFARKTLDELNAERPLKDVFFDLDDSVIGQDGRAILQKNAQWLLRWTSTRVTIEGHCDGRGTSEYNLALGDRRAQAIRAYLGSLGVAPDRVLVLSKGKEAPVCSETDESCWQQNRRGHPIIAAK
jgi:peptidoglycan-associated lipoprotein